MADITSLRKMGARRTGPDAEGPSDREVAPAHSAPREVSDCAPSSIPSAMQFRILRVRNTAEGVDSGDVFAAVTGPPSDWPDKLTGRTTGGG